jgi:hypothetical protein
MPQPLLQTYHALRLLIDAQHPTTATNNTPAALITQY